MATVLGEPSLAEIERGRWRPWLAAQAPRKIGGDYQRGNLARRTHRRLHCARGHSADSRTALRHMNPVRDRSRESRHIGT